MKLMAAEIATVIAVKGTSAYQVAANQIMGVNRERAKRPERENCALRFN